VEPLKNLDKDFLGEIPGVIPVPEKPDPQGKNSGLVFLYQSGKAFLFPGKNFTYNFQIRILFGFVVHALLSASRLPVKEVKYIQADPYGQRYKPAEKGIRKTLL
jgi:hypothetical protein